MVAESLLALSLCLVAAPPEGSGPPTITIEELNASVEAGNYHRIRVEKVGHRLQGTASVEKISVNDSWPLLDLEGHLLVALRGLPEDHGLEPGDRVRFDGLIVDEAYFCLYVWTYDYEKLPAEEPAKASTGEQAAEAVSDASDDLPTIRFCESPPPVSPSARSLSLHEQAQRNASRARTSQDLLPKITTADLDACDIGGDYLRVREEFVGLRLDADVVVEKVIEKGGDWALVRLSDNWQAHLNGHRVSNDLKEGDRLRIVGLIVDEAYGAVTVWVERGEYLPSK